MNAVFEEISKIGLVPVIKLDDADAALPLANALREGGLSCAEITFRTDAAVEAIRLITGRFPDMLVGAGTVLSAEQADAAIDAGARFIVSPGLNPDVVKHCLDKNIAVAPGCATPSDMECAIALGLDVVKFFPAEALGGLSVIKAASAPYPGIKFMPTGGISEDNLNSYLAFPKVIACGGSFMVKEDLVNNGEFDKITKLVRHAVDTMLGFEVGHVGINTESKNEADTLARFFESSFGFTTSDSPGKIGYFAGKGIELLHDAASFTGEKGHIAILTNSVERAIYHLGRKGIEFDENTARREGGRRTFIYLKGLYSGFAIHLSQRK